MSRPSKTAEAGPDFRIQSLKALVDKSFEILIISHPDISSDLKELKSLTFNLYSECILSCQKEKQKSQSLFSQFDQIQQEAALEFSFRQNDLIKQLDLFEAKLKCLREENRSMYDQLENSFHSFESLKKQSISALNEISSYIKASSSFFNPRELEAKLRGLKDLIENHSGVSEKLLIQSLEPLISIESSRFLEPVQNSPVTLREPPPGFQFRNKLESLKFISDEPAVKVTTERDSVSSLNFFLEDSYIKTLAFEKAKEKADSVKFESENKRAKDLKKDEVETFRSGSEVQIKTNDSFMTLNDSPDRQTVSTIFPELEESPYNKFKLQFY